MPFAYFRHRLHVPNMGARTGVVLLSGGAKGAYQAGVLRALAELWPQEISPFSVFTGVSAGAINAIHMATHASQFHAAAQSLCDLWNSFHFEDVFDTSPTALTKRGMRWLLDLSSGGAFGPGRGLSLLDTRPLTRRLSKLFDRERLLEQFSHEVVHAVGLTATHYPSGTSVTFYEGAPTLQPWQRATRLGVQTHISLAHVLASAAIPVFFPAVEIEGNYYGDGAIRMTAPLSPALHLGAERLLAIALHPKEDTPPSSLFQTRTDYPSMAETGGVLMNSLFLPTLDADVERLLRINQTLQFVPPSQGTPLRKIPILVLRPSLELGALVKDVLSHFPYAVKHLLRGLGATETSGFELLSYLAFEPQYTGRLMDLGYHDTLRQRRTVEEFLLG